MKTKTQYREPCDCGAEDCPRCNPELREILRDWREEAKLEARERSADPDEHPG